MDKVKIVKKDSCSLQELLEGLKRSPEAFKCGAIVCFVGIVRGEGRRGGMVRKLIYEAREKEALKVLGQVREETLRENRGARDLLICHVVDELEPGDETLYILAIGEHGGDALNAVSQALEKVRTRPPIWKKEVTDEGEYWVEEV